MLRSLVLSLVLGLAVAGILGCHGADSNSPEKRGADVASAISGGGTPVMPGEFDLGLTPHEHPDPACDVHTHLSLRPTIPDMEPDADGWATLHEVVSEYCDQWVPPNWRSYLVNLQSIDECNSMTYIGWSGRNGISTMIELTDHRNRVCDDLVPARIIVTETVDGVATTLYSRDDDAVPETVTLTGTLESLYAIGGETTGYGLVTEDEGTLELVLQGKDEAQFEEGKTARVTGTRTLLSGEYTHDRPAIDVTDMIVCPSVQFINCQPGPGRLLSRLCFEREWVITYCPGVEYDD